MAKKQEEKERPVIDFDKVMQDIKMPEHIRMCNINKELGYKPAEVPEELLQPTRWEYRQLYYEYLRWLEDQGIRNYHFL